MVKLNKSKKAMEMSINLIIMLVIGLTIMGLIISFVTSFLGDAEDSFASKLSEDHKTNIESVKRLNGNFEFLDTTVILTKGKTEKKKIYVKFRNPTTSPLPNLFDGGDIVDASGNFFASITYAGTETVSGITIYGPPISLNEGENAGFPLQVQIDKTTEVGSYFIKFTATIDNEEYNEVITLEVK